MPKPSNILTQKFDHSPTPGQQKVFEQLDAFIESNSDKATFVLRGYAGTGKTSLLTALVKTLPLFNYKFVLLAPTGRAAKVMSQYTKKTAYTIHKRIYKTKNAKDDSGPEFSQVKNYSHNTIFIVDEASMIGTETDFKGRSLLDDLIRFVFENQGNKLLLIGDTAQLPPVHQSESKSLDPEYLNAKYGLLVTHGILTEITRQALESGILLNATNIRNELNKNEIDIRFQTRNLADVYRMNSERLGDGLQYAYDKYGMENSLIICRSNRSAVMYNHFIRNQLLWKEEELDAGDLLMIARNNYHYASDEIPAGFLANGDFAEVMKIRNLEEIHGLRFADVELRLTDYDKAPAFEAKLILDGLHSYTPALTQDQNRALYQSVLEDYQDLSGKKQQEALKQDKYLNALQVKYAYALTCHKSQGGQWDAVFVDQGYLGELPIDADFTRWTYTAITRAKNELFLVNFDTKFYRSTV